MPLFKFASGYNDLYGKYLLQGNGGQKHIGRILEFFETTDGEHYFRVQWFYKVEDTVSIQIVLNMTCSFQYIFIIINFFFFFYICCLLRLSKKKVVFMTRGVYSILQ